jgi:hypothetical protein
MSPTVVLITATSFSGTAGLAAAGGVAGATGATGVGGGGDVFWPQPLISASPNHDNKRLLDIFILTNYLHAAAPLSTRRIEALSCSPPLYGAGTPPM